MAPHYTLFKEGWGQTELAGGVTGMARPYGGVKLGSCNQVVPNTRLQVRHTETDLPLGAGETGEIVVKGPQAGLSTAQNTVKLMSDFILSTKIFSGRLSSPVR